MYQGHKNWNHWSVSIWLNNYVLYKLCQSVVRQARTLDEAARVILTQLPDKTPDGMPVTFASVRAALEHGAFA